ncbi:putative membrane protein YkoI [Paenibacillus endophyticus]|uniref:Putative membrane protein YkoI n=1 Tax=Paenibacillus endophyticus TaxID=1294268 RepID=A0A7W5G7V4_9BACL|nr:PepSY domain-containing protein [Paenibacillus endophyticus]MBB3150354.1 putative membrane protein YkoI [Paenibacillus endophyticus]
MKNKKGWIIGLGLVVALGGTSAVVAAEAASSYISKDKAKQIALLAAPGSVTDIELEHKRNSVYYEVDIDRKDTFQEVDVHVEAVSGKVLSIKNDDDNYTAHVAPAPVANDAAVAAAGEAAASNSTGATSASTKSITKEQAGKLAQQKVKGDIIRVETDWDDGIKKYEVKLKTAAGRAEVDIAAANGKVLDIDYEDDRNDDDDNYDDDNDDHDGHDGHDGQDDDDYDDDDRD